MQKYFFLWHKNTIDQLDKDAEISKLKAENHQLRKENKELKDHIIALEKLVDDLQAQINQLTIKKTSSNSSIPPSVDLLRKSKSLRTPRGKKSGGQTGHAGSTLKMKESSDEIHKIVFSHIGFFRNIPIITNVD